MIKIEQLLPLLKNGWVAMDKNKDWWWYETKPSQKNCDWLNYEYADCCELSSCLNIEPVENWTKSLMRCGDE